MLSSYFYLGNPKVADLELAKRLDHLYWQVNILGDQNANVREESLAGKAGFSRQRIIGEVQLGLNALKRAAHIYQNMDANNPPLFGENPKDFSVTAEAIVGVEKRFRELLVPIMPEITETFMGHG